MDVVRDDMQIVGVRDDSDEGERWRKMISCGDLKKTLGNSKRGRIA